MLTMLKLAYMLISACGDERCFPINPAELYAFNALVIHLELTEEQRERAVAVAKMDLGRSCDPWSLLRTQLKNTTGRAEMCWITRSKPFSCKGS